jgi:hypothetical protein
MHPIGVHLFLIKQRGGIEPIKFNSVEYHPSACGNIIIKSLPLGSVKYYQKTVEIHGY